MKFKLSFMKPDEVLKLSNGEVLFPELINLRTLKPIPNGLLCEKIFGPIRNYECNCGRHKGKEYKGKICKICRVEITTSLVRTKRMGHITLPEPVVHPLAIKHLATLLGITAKTIRQILDGEYFVGYTEDLDGPLILRIKKQLLQVRITTLDTSKKFRRGPKGLYDIVKNIVLQETYNITPEGYKKHIFKKLIDAGYHPKDYFLKYLPVSPAAYRPVLDMGAGVMISNAINELYIRVLHRKNRIERFREHCKIKLIEDEELVQLQKAVDELLIKGARGRDGQYIPGKIHTICKKQGLIRNNLLGKRVDFSGRSVITAGPHLKLDEVGIPFEMAYTLFTPFIIAELIQNKVVESYTGAMYLLGLKKKKKRKRKDLPEKVLKAFDTVVKRHRILLNRQPTLHKFNMQSFKIKITNNRAVELTPMACGPCNGDFDGDSLAVHLPLSKQALKEVENMSLTKNLLSPMDSSPMILPSHEMIIGIQHMTNIIPSDKPKLFSSYSSLIQYHQLDIIRINDEIIWLDDGGRKSTCLGRLMLERMFQVEVNKTLGKKNIKELISKSHDRISNQMLVKSLDKLKNISYKYATKSGLTLCIDDFQEPSTKEKVVNKCLRIEKNNHQAITEGIKTEDEAYEHTIRTWSENLEGLWDTLIEEIDRKNPLYQMWLSGARCSKEQVSQMTIAKGLIADSGNRILEHPILHNFRTGLDPIEYFISTKGARKGTADKKFITPVTGYLARKLVNAARDLYISEEDCGTTQGIPVRSYNAAGRFTTDGKLVKENKIQDKIKIRSPIFCKAKKGICQKCYGIDPATRKLVKIKHAVGVIAGQSLSEPCTQMCLSGETEILVINGKSIKIKEVKNILDKNEEVFVFSISPDGVPEVARVIDAFSQRKEKIKIKVTLDNDKTFEGTLDHPVMLRDGTYKQLKELKLNDSLMPFNHTVKNIEIIEMDDCENFYDITVDSEHHNFSLAAGCFVHNSLRTFHLGGAATLGKSPMNIISALDGKLTLEKEGNFIHLNINSHNYIVDSEARILAKKGQVKKGDLLATYVKENLTNEDIVGKLPRLISYFELFSPVQETVIANITGPVELEVRNNRIVLTINGIFQGEVRNTPVFIYNGQYVEKGDFLTYGEGNLRKFYRENQDLETVTVVYRRRLRELYAEEGVDINPVHLEIILRACTEVVGMNNRQYGLRRYGDEGEIQLFGINQTSWKYPSWLKGIGHGWTKQILTEAAINFSETYDLPTERIMHGGLIIEKETAG